MISSHLHDNTFDVATRRGIQGSTLVDVTGSPRPPAAYLFGDFHLDTLRRMLFRRSEIIPLPERLFQMLLLLLQANGEVVDKETLAKRVWPAGIVTDGNIAQHMYLLRQLLGESASDRSLIMTVSGRGYRFTKPVISEPRQMERSAVDAGEVLLASGFDPFRNFCHGSFLLEKRTAPALRRAMDFFEQSLRSDEQYTPALIGIARSYALLAQFGHVPPRNAFRKAKAAVEHALRSDPSSAIAHAVLSEILAFGDWNWTAAEHAIDTAIRLNPSSSLVHACATWFYVCAGSYESAFEHARRALMADPSSLPLLTSLARTFVHAGRYGDGIVCLSNVIESDPEFYVARRFRAQAFLLNGQPEEAAGDLMLLPQERSEDPSWRLPLLARAYADSGDNARGEAIYAKLQEMTSSEYVLSWNLAIVAVSLGRHDEAMLHLEKAFQDREPALTFLKSLPWFRQIADRPRFREIARFVGPRP
jgi:DNA-binding winged helix-turn-helix (wHTH) protein/tetratricopeptide (TPR) repeat protein